MISIRAHTVTLLVMAAIAAAAGRPGARAGGSFLLLASSAADRPRAASQAAAQERMPAAQHFTVRGEHVVTVRSTPPFYEPNGLRLQAGDTVRWVNPARADRHSVREAAGGAFAFDLEPGETARVTLRRAGTYRYQCRFHPWMSGEIIVEPRQRPIAWTTAAAAPSGFTGAQLARAPDGRSAVVIGTGEYPLIARVSVPASGSRPVPASMTSGEHVAARRDAAIGSRADVRPDEGIDLRVVGRLRHAVRVETASTLASDGGLWLLARERGVVLRFDTHTGGTARFVLADEDVRSEAITTTAATAAATTRRAASGPSIVADLSIVVAADIAADSATDITDGVARSIDAEPAALRGAASGAASARRASGASAGVWVYDERHARVRWLTTSDPAAPDVSTRARWRSLDLPSAVVRMAAVDDRLWLLLADGAVVRYDATRDRVKSGPLPASVAVSAAVAAADRGEERHGAAARVVAAGVLVAHDESAWLLPPAGDRLLRFDAGERRVAFSPAIGARLSHLDVTRGGDVWLMDAARGQLARLQDGAIEPIATVPAASRVRGLAVLQDGIVCLLDEQGRVGMVALDALQAADVSSGESRLHSGEPAARRAADPRR